MYTAGKLMGSRWRCSAAITVGGFVAAACTEPASTPIPTGHWHAQLRLQAHLQTTAPLSVPSASGPMASGAVADDQPDRSQDPGHGAARTAHQREREAGRLLGGGTP